MPDDPINRLRLDLKEDLAALRGDLAKLVSRELHDAQLDRVRDQVATVVRDLDRLNAAVEADREAAKKRREIEAEHRAADRRMTKGALLGVALSIVVQVLSNAGVLL